MMWSLSESEKAVSEEELKKMAEEMLLQIEMYAKSEYNEPPELVDGHRYPSMKIRKQFLISKLQAAYRLGAERERERWKPILEYAVCKIQDWHNITNRNLSQTQIVNMWRIYYEQSPEMNMIRDALKE